MEVKVIDQTGKATSKKVALTETIFGIEPNDHAIYLDVKQHLANKRQGTHKAKERNEIAGSTRKIKKQKGTGGARAGSIKSGTIVGGGRIFSAESIHHGGCGIGRTIQTGGGCGGNLLVTPILHGSLCTEVACGITDCHYGSDSVQCCCFC